MLLWNKIISENQNETANKFQLQILKSINKTKARSRRGIAMEKPCESSFGMQSPVRFPSARRIKKENQKSVVGNQRLIIFLVEMKTKTEIHKDAPTFVIPLGFAAQKK